MSEKKEYKNMHSEPIRIAEIVGKWVGGGVEAFIMNYYRNIDKTKIQFDFICDSDSTDIPYEEIEDAGGRVILIPPYEKVIPYHKELKKVLTENNYKIVHSHINTMSVFPLFAAKCVGVPVRIAHSHSTTSKLEKKRNLIKLVLRPLVPLFATHFFACTEHAGRWAFGNKRFDNGNVTVINNAIDVKAFNYNEEVRNAKRKELNINDKTIVFGHAGRFVSVKNHSFIVDVFNEFHKENSDSLLLLAGQGPLLEDVSQKVRRLGLQNDVLFLGQRTDISELYQAFDVFLLPSLYEGLGMVLIEAQCAGNLCFASTEVPKETKMTENIEHLDISMGSEYWSEQITTRIKNFKRENHGEEIKIYGYDIKDEVKKLELLYKKMEENVGGKSICDNGDL